MHHCYITLDGVSTLGLMWVDILLARLGSITKGRRLGRAGLALSHASKRRVPALQASITDLTVICSTLGLGRPVQVILGQIDHLHRTCHFGPLLDGGFLGRSDLSFIHSGSGAGGSFTLGPSCLGSACSECCICLRSRSLSQLRRAIVAW